MFLPAPHPPSLRPEWQPREVPCSSKRLRSTFRDTADGVGRRLIGVCEREDAHFVNDKLRVFVVVDVEVTHAFVLVIAGADEMHALQALFCLGEISSNLQRLWLAAIAPIDEHVLERHLGAAVEITLLLNVERKARQIEASIGRE